MQQKIIFTKGQDFDNSPESDEMQVPGKARKRINVRVLSSDNDQAGAIESVLGNTLIDTFVDSYTLPAGDNKVIGSEEDKIRQKIYYFVYNSNSDHVILQYDEVAENITCVLQSSDLNFNVDYLITGIDFVELDENNHLLYWTDYYNEPRKINIEKGIYFMAGDFVNGYKSPFNPEILYRIKQPMLLSPTAIYDNDATALVNRLDKKLFQFKVQFVYDDSEVTAWSPITITPLPLTTEIAGVNNVIKLTVDTGISIVTRIRIAVAETTETNFKLVVDLDKAVLGIADDTTYDYYFYNNGNYPTLGPRESNKLFDNVPKLSQSQEIVKPARITDGNIVEGFDPVPVDLQLDFTLNQDNLTYSVDFIEVNAYGTPIYMASQPTIAVTGDGSGATAEITEVIGFSVDVIKKGFGYAGTPGLTAVGGGGTGMLLSATLNFLNQIVAVSVDAPGVGYTHSPDVVISGAHTLPAELQVKMRTSKIVVTDGGSGYTTASATSSIPSETYTVALTSIDTVPICALKRGEDSIFGIIYYDHGNRSGVTNINDGRFDQIQANGILGTELFIPFYTELNTNSAAILDFNMSVGGVLINSGGSAYTGATTVTFSAPVSGTTPTGTPVIGTGAIIELTLTNAGATYPADGDFTANLLGGSGTGAQVSITITGGIVTAFSVLAGGTGYLNTDAVTVDPSTFAPPPGTDAAFTVLISDYQTIIDVTVVSGTGVYTSMPTVTVVDGGGGFGADIDALMFLANIIIVDGSGGYITAPAITFTGGSPSVVATATTTLTSGVVTGTTITNPGSGYQSFPTLVVAGQIYGGSYPTVNWAIYNVPPSWATHYQIARTKNIANGRFIQFVAEGISYYDSKNNALSFGNNLITQISVNILNISGVTNSFLTYNPGSKLVYDFAPGDRIRFIKDQSGNFLNNYYDFAIDSYNVASGAIRATFPAGVYPGTFPNLQAGALFEIYQPLLDTTTDSKLTFEIGEGGYIDIDGDGNYYHKGETHDQSYWAFDASSDNGGFVEFSGPTSHGLNALDKIKIAQDAGFVNASYNTYAIILSVTATTITVNIPFGSADPAITGIITAAATGVFNSGDTFYRPRTMPYSTGSGFFTYLIEDISYSDLYASQYPEKPGYDCGRPNRIDKLFKEISRISTIYYSETFVPETFINGLSSVYDDNFESYDSNFGGIYKLYSENQSLICYQELKISNIMVSQIIYNSLSGGDSVGASESVLSPQAMYYAGEFGIGKHPESFAVYGKAKYCLDPKRGVAIRLSIDGITPISDTGFMHNYFTDKCKELVESGDQIRFYGVYDMKFNEYVISLGKAEPEEGDIVETLAWNEKENQWSTFYSYIPENMCSLNTGIVSFKAGELYVHNTNVIYGNFYGVQYQPEFWVYGNINPSNVKVLNAISEETNAAWEVYSITTPDGQASGLISSTFELLTIGSGYSPDGVYPGISLIGGIGYGAVAEVTIASGEVSIIVITAMGTGYESQDILTVDPSTFTPAPTTDATLMYLSNFEEKENNQYAGVLKDVNTPNVTDPLYEGDDMRDRTFLVKFRYKGIDYNKINAVNFYYDLSELSNRN